MKKLATLEVWLDEDYHGEGSSFTKYSSEDNLFQIYLHPQVDKRVAGADKATVLAHELGHFVGKVFDTPAASQSGSPNTTPEQMLAGEREAWEFADQMQPGLKNSRVAKTVLRHYEDIAEDAPGLPVGLLKMLGFIR